MADDARVEARTNAAKARERVIARDEFYVARAQPGRTTAVDVIDGHVNPELFMPYELFESLIRRGFVGESWRDFHEAHIITVGLPPSFWSQLEVLAAPYISLLRRRHAGTSEADSAEFMDALCRERALALQRARDEFGESLERLLYVHIAPGMSIFHNNLPRADELRRLSRGCL